jgi:tetratricopeptide (TPR) repeat protein
MGPMLTADEGHLDAKSPTSLKEAGNAALQAGDFARAARMYTLGIDLACGSTEPAASDWFRLDGESGGVLSTLLSNRSLTYLQQGDHAAAALDAEHCCLSRPDWPKAHLRLLAALEAAEEPVGERLATVERALRACPLNVQLKEAKATLLGKAGESTQASLVQSHVEAAAQLAAARRVADDSSDPRRFVAAGDLGAAFALGVHGVAKDLEAAERYLRIGASGGDAVSQRNLGHLLLQLDRPTEAADALRDAATQGDENAQQALSQLALEADRKAEEARFQLRAMASRGDARAIQMLEQLQSVEGLA